MEIEINKYGEIKKVFYNILDNKYNECVDFDGYEYEIDNENINKINSYYDYINEIENILFRKYNIRY